MATWPSTWLEFLRTLVFPIVYFVTLIPEDMYFTADGARSLFFAIFFFSMPLSFLAGMKTIYCVTLVPAYFVLLLFFSLLLHSSSQALLYVAISFFLAALKVEVPISICLHSYAARAAFTCAPSTRILLLFLSALSNQGGWISLAGCYTQGAHFL